MDIYFKSKCWEIGSILKRKDRINLLGFNLGWDPSVDVECGNPCGIPRKSNVLCSRDFGYRVDIAAASPRVN